MVKRFAIVSISLLILLGACYLSTAVGYLVGGPQYAGRFSPADATYREAHPSSAPAELRAFINAHPAGFRP